MYVDSGTALTAARELGRYKLDLVGVQAVRWDKEGTVRAGDHNFLYGKDTKIVSWEQDFCTQQNIISR